MRDSVLTLRRRVTFAGLVLLVWLVIIVPYAAASKDAFVVTIANNPALNASFYKKEKTKDRGWKIYVRFTNKTGKPIRSIGTRFELREGEWRVANNSNGRWSSSVLLPPNSSDVFGWIDEVPSSVDRIHITEVEVE